MKTTPHLTIEDFDRQYSTSNKVLRALLEFRMSEDGFCFNPNCPYDVPINKYYVPVSNRTAFLCRMCQEHFYPMADSIMYKSHVRPEHWFQVIYRMLASRNGISMQEIFRTYGYQLPTVFNMMHAIRRQMNKCLDFKFQNIVVEIDASGVSTGKKGYNKHFKMKSGRGSQRKANVLVIKSRGNKAKFYIVNSEEEESVLRVIEQEVDKSCLIITDEFGAYNALTRHGYNHVVINHKSANGKARRFKDGIASTNYAEGLFSVLKRNIRGAHIHVSNTYLENYLSECAFRLTYAEEFDYGFNILINSFGSLSNHYSKHPGKPHRKIA